jgi:hypothetical protein
MMRSHGYSKLTDLGVSGHCNVQSRRGPQMGADAVRDGALNVSQRRRQRHVNIEHSLTVESGDGKCRAIVFY